MIKGLDAVTAIQAVTVTTVFLLACSFCSIVEEAVGGRTPVAQSSATSQLSASQSADPTGKTAKSKSGIVTSVTLAPQTAEDSREALNPTDIFSPAQAFHAVVGIKDAPTGSQFRANWYAEDIGKAGEPNTLIDHFDLSSEGTRNLDFTLRPTRAWPVGTYRVEIFVNGSLEETIRFSVR